MIKTITGMTLAAVFMGVGFKAGMMVNAQPVQNVQMAFKQAAGMNELVASQDAGFTKLLKETADHMNLPPARVK